MSHPEQNAIMPPSRRTKFSATLAGSFRRKGASAPSLRLLALLVLASIALLALFATPAFAERGHKYLGQTIGEKCTVEPCAPGRLKEPAGLAVDEATGEIYVVDKGNNRVERFDDATGAFLGSFNGGPAYEKEPGVTESTTEAGHGGSPDEQPTGRFEEPSAIAVDNSCHLHAPPLTGSACEAFDPSYGSVYVVDKGHRVVDKFGPTGEYLGQITATTVSAPGGFFLSLAGVAIDAGGAVWITEEHYASGSLVEPRPYADKFTNAADNEFVAPSHILESSGYLTFGSNFTPALAVDSENDLYVPNLPGGSVARISKFTATGGLLSEEFFPSGLEGTPSGLALESTTDQVYVDDLFAWTRYAPDGKQVETLPVPGSHGAALAVDASTAPGASTVFVADPSADVVYVYPPEPPGPPTVEDASVAEVTANSAHLLGKINPRSELGEEPTTYRFEYGICASFLTCASSPFEASVPVPAGELEANYEPDSLAVDLEGLAPHATYHFRLVAENSLSTEPTLSEERIFTTQTSGPLTLPDNRGWEMVSPPEKHGAIIEPISFAGLIQASASGDAISYVANAPTEANPAGFSQGVQILSRRAGQVTAPWLSADIATPHATAVGVELNAIGEYTFFSPDLSRAVVEPHGLSTPLSPEATERTSYLRTDFPLGDIGDPCASSCYQPLVTASNVPEGTEFGEEGTCSEACGPRFLGATPDLTHLVLSSSFGLTETPGDNGGLYEWADGQLRLISIRPEAEGRVPVSFSTRPALGFSNQDTRSAISTDGSRVIWFEGTQNQTVSGNHHLFLRDTVREQTLRLDVKQPGASGKGTVEPIFQTATPDGSRIFFTDTQQLTPGASESGADLYECQIEEAEEGLKCNLSDLTAQGSGEAAALHGAIPGASEDGSSVFFTANGVLTTTPNARGEVASPGKCGNGEGAEAAINTCNLYLRRDGTTRLVAVLSGVDAADWARGGQALRLTARVSPNGRYLAFMSQRPLTGYDNSDAISGKRDEEVFLYDAQANGGEGGLVCASCDPTGARPHGVEYGQIDVNGGGLAGGDGIWAPNIWIAANVPAWTIIRVGDGIAHNQSRYLSDRGRLFFNSADALVPKDSNGTEDVYQYEPPGSTEGAPASDSCTESSPTFSPASGGCTSLISSGSSGEESAFMDASESGDDIFFLAAGQLSRRDEDTALDVYDARVSGGEEEPIEPVECAGDACQLPATPPNDPTPGSLGFHGAGNVTPEGKAHKKKKHAKKKHQSKKHTKKSKRQANRNRGGNR